MLNRKLESAVLTIIIGYFIVPFLFSEWRTDYFTIGLMVTPFAIPFVFIVGILFSWWLEKRITNPILFVVLHGLFGGVMSALFSWLLLMGQDIATFFIAGLIYATLFSLLDLVLRKTRFYKKHTEVELG